MVFTRRQSSRLAAITKSHQKDDGISVDSANEPTTVTRNSPELLEPLGTKRSAIADKALPNPPQNHELGASTFNKEARTPSSKSPLRPSRAEMHPDHCQRTTSTLLEDARWLGFLPMGAQTVPPRPNVTLEEKLAAQTPSKTPSFSKTSAALGKFEFTFRRQSSVELSDDAQRMMAESREEARKMRERLMADLPSVPSDEPGEKRAECAGETVMSTRKIAKPKGKSGRFSAAHQAAFDKMDSIANHPSAWRTDPNRFKNADLIPAKAASLKRTHSKTELTLATRATAAAPNQPNTVPAHKAAIATLKRSPSKAELDKRENSPFVTQPLDGPLSSTNGTSSPIKRIKLARADDTAKARQNDEARTYGAFSTPRSVGSRITVSRPFGFSHLMTPTKASLARSHSVKTNKTSRLPMSTFRQAAAVQQSQIPRHFNFKPDLPAQYTTNDDKLATSLPRTPKAQESHKVTKPVTPTPIKVAVAIKDDPIMAPKELTDSPDASVRKDTRVPSAPNTAKRAFAKLKSCLRTPQRLYSDDPFKIAAGTHLATPPGQRRQLLYPPIPATAPVRKHVDFTASANEKAQKDEAKAMSTGSDSGSDENMYPALPSVDTEQIESTTFGHHSTNSTTAFTFRVNTPLKFTPLTQHTQMATIRAVRSSDADNTMSSVSRTPLRAMSEPPSRPIIATTPGKRKHADLNMSSINEENDDGNTSDKENRVNRMPGSFDQADDGEETTKADATCEVDDRPAKKLRRAEMQSSASISNPDLPSTGLKSGTSVPVQKKKSKLPAAVKAARNQSKKVSTGISAARLSMLAQPKRRV